MTPPSRVAACLATLVTATALTSGCAASTSPHGHTITRGTTDSPAPGPQQPGTSKPTPPPAPGKADPLAGHQLITVTARSYGATFAELTAYQRAGGRWQRILGPWTARIGRNGFAPPGGKREGDGRTPSGSFRIPFFFGALQNPGFRFPYRRAHTYDFWDDDPASPLYNEWVDTRYASAGVNPEPMDVSAYDYGAVIGYNTAQTPGMGSAIFLHVNIGIATAGCVTLPMRKLLTVLRWVDPARSPRIQLGVGEG
ncbi:MAG TPA: L,D-transpeptidase family protein [Streptosporangiaceae bacterium]|nr:L,D-transpeptidase family protein [Streptosporangiaceae bacterium]